MGSVAQSFDLALSLTLPLRLFRRSKSRRKTYTKMSPPTPSKQYSMSSEVVGSIPSRPSSYLDMRCPIRDTAAAGGKAQIRLALRKAMMPSKTNEATQRNVHAPIGPLRSSIRRCKVIGRRSLERCNRCADHISKGVYVELSYLASLIALEGCVDAS